MQGTQAPSFSSTPNGDPASWEQRAVWYVHEVVACCKILSSGLSSSFAVRLCGPKVDCSRLDTLGLVHTQCYASISDGGEWLLMMVVR